MTNWGSLLNVRGPGHDADHSSISTAEVKNEWR